MKTGNQLVFYCYAAGKTWDANLRQELALDGGDRGLVYLKAPESTNVHRLYCRAVKVTVEEITEDELRQAEADGFRRNMDDCLGVSFVTGSDACKWFGNLVYSSKCDAYRIHKLHNHKVICSGWIGYKGDEYAIDNRMELVNDFAMEIGEMRGPVKFEVCAYKLDADKSLLDQMTDDDLIALETIHVTKEGKNK